MTAAERERRFLEIYRENRARLTRLCYGFVRSREDAEDLLQEIFTHVWNGLPGFRQEAAIGTWLYRIAVNSALVHRHKQTSSEPLEELPDRGRGPREQFEESERLAGLRRAVASLPDQDRVIVTLLLEGLSYKEIADVAGLTVNHVGVKILRAKQALEVLLKEPSLGNI